MTNLAMPRICLPIFIYQNTMHHRYLIFSSLAWSLSWFPSAEISLFNWCVSTVLCPFSKIYLKLHILPQSVSFLNSHTRLQSQYRQRNVQPYLTYYAYTGELYLLCVQQKRVFFNIQNFLKIKDLVESQEEDSNFTSKNLP